MEELIKTTKDSNESTIVSDIDTRVFLDEFDRFNSWRDRIMGSRHSKGYDPISIKIFTVLK